MYDPHFQSCTCHRCKPTTAKEEKNDRREFIKSLGTLGLTLSTGPLLAGILEGDEKNLKVIDNSRAVNSGKAQKITLLHTADIHAQLYTHDEFFVESGEEVYKKRGGLAVLKTMINTLRNENPSSSILIDGGDCFQGGGVAALTKGAGLVPLINNIGYDLTLPGNWEVIYGKKMMLKDMGAYTSAKVCANMFHDTPGNTNNDMIFPAYWIKTFGKVKLGFIGYNDPLTPKRQSPAYSKGIRFAKPEENVKKYIKILKEQEGCIMVFLVTHMGLAQQVDLANKAAIQGVDYILGADTHERIRKPLEGKYAKVTEPGAFGSFISKLDIVIENGKIVDQNYQLLDVDPDKFKPDQEMEKLIEEARAPFKKDLDTVIGTSKSTLVRYYVLETPMDNMITDAIMWKYKPDIALSNGFRFCPPLVPDLNTKLAEITNDYLWSMLPDNSLAKQGIVSGDQIWEWLEKELENVFSNDPAKRFGGWLVRFKGMEINFTLKKDFGKRLNWVKIKGEPLDIKRLYTIVACEREGDPVNTLCRMENVRSAQTLPLTLHQILKEYLIIHSPVAPVLENRASATDANHTLLGELENYDYQFR